MYRAAPVGMGRSGVALFIRLIAADNRPGSRARVRPVRGPTCGEVAQGAAMRMQSAAGGPRRLPRPVRGPWRIVEGLATRPDAPPENERRAALVRAALVLLGLPHCKLGQELARTGSPSLPGHAARLGPGGGHRRRHPRPSPDVPNSESSQPVGNIVERARGSPLNLSDSRGA